MSLDRATSGRRRSSEPLRSGVSREPHTDDRLFLTAAEVGRRLGLRKSRVYELAAAGVLPVVRLSPRRMLFPRRGLEDLVEAAIERARARTSADPAQDRV
jgi:excisionase family DNA binding protein